ncbi:MAG: gamma carbonic anhydrase family protein [Bdellovibrionales bacterium]|nr:gamma carbonic anhydrase family protein [Bdellovibrionales bacterium]
MLLPIRGFHPKLGTNCFVAPTATVIGDVELGEECSILFGAVLRGDVMPIKIGRQCNIQDNVVVHGTYQSVGTTLSDRVSVGHGAILHGTTIGAETLIGMGAILMDHSHIGKNCLIAAGSLVPEGMDVPDGHLAIGRPARVKRPLTEEEIGRLKKSADNYLFYKTWYESAGGTDV